MTSLSMRMMLVLTMICLLQGCFNIATSGAQAVYNRHNWQRNFKDQMVAYRANRALNLQTSEFNDTNITIATMDGDVLIAGQVPSAWQKDKAEALVRNVPDVKTVYNTLTVASPSSSLTRMSDIWITTKVKVRLMASDDVDATQLKVVTENGKVYLMGTLQKEEADAAVDIASTTDGVQSVVKIFSYVTISKQA